VMQTTRKVAAAISVSRRITGLIRAFMGVSSTLMAELAAF
jgi:hypothetical protein